MGKQWKQWETSFSWTSKSLQSVTAAMKLKDPRSLEEKLWRTCLVCMLVTQSCPTLCDTMACSTSGFPCPSPSPSSNFMAAITIHSDFGAQENKVCHFPFYPIYLPWRDGTGCHDLSFLIVEFCQLFPPSSFIFIKILLSSSFFATIRVVSSAYLKLLIFLLAILIPAGASFSLVYLMMYSVYKLNKQSDNI